MSYTEIQIKEIRDAFNLYDRDCDGKLTHTELGVVIRALGRAPTESDLTSISEGLTRESVELVSFDQLVEILKDVDSKKLSKEELIDILKILDKDGKGYIESSELLHALTSIGDAMPREDVEAIIREFDPKAEGRIDFDEFVEEILKDY